MKQSIRTTIATRKSNFLLISSSVSSFNGGGCIIPIRKIMIKAKNHHPVNIIIIIAIHPAYFCLSPFCKLIKGGDLIEGKIKCKIQDAYSMRSTPQVIGAAHDLLSFARSQVEIELNGVGIILFFSQRKIFSYQVPTFKAHLYLFQWIWQVLLLQWFALCLKED